MNEEIQALLRRARRFLQAAENQLRSGFPEDAASRAYYAMFTAAKAMILPWAPKVTRHELARKKFEEVFINTGRVERKFLTYLEVGLQSRHFADYETDLTYVVTPEEAEARLREATEFVAMAEEFVKKAGGELEHG
jgi:uncharacterized protein (UPF0332 family)